MNRTAGHHRGTTVAVLSLTALALFLSAKAASAQVYPYKTVLRISVTPRFPDGISNTIATLGQAKDGSIALIVRSFAPDTLNLRGGGRFVTVRIEAENNRAAEIDLTTLALSVDGAIGAVPASEQLAPALLHFDGDLNIDLEMKFDRAALIGLLDQLAGPTAIVRASWHYSDGTDGTASAQARVKR